MNNTTRIANALIENGIATKEQVEATLAKGKRLPFMTYDEWKLAGYQVKKGEKALFKCLLWKALTRKVKNAEGKTEYVKVVDEKGNQKFITPYCAIFSYKQVEKIGESQTETRKEENKAKEEKAVVYEKKPGKATTRKAKKTKAVKTNKKATTKKATKKLAKATSTVQSSRVENGINIVRFEMKKSDGNVARIEMPFDTYLNMKAKDKKQFNKAWGIA